MPGIVTQAETGGLEGKIYLDESGGYLQIGVTSYGYTMLHKFHVNPFDSAGGAYNTVGASQETNVIETASNLVELIAGLYEAQATIQALVAYQVSPDKTGVLPTALDLSAAASAGTEGGATAGSVYTLMTLTGHGSDWSRWHVGFHGMSGTWVQEGGRVPLNTSSITPLKDLGHYLYGSSAGTGLAGVGAGLFTQVVTHSGEPLIGPMYVVGSLSKRIRRRFRAL